MDVQIIFLLFVNDLSSIINTTEKVFQFADDTSIVCCGNKSMLHGKIKEFSQKTEGYVEMNKLTLNANKTELKFFWRNNSDFGYSFLNRINFLNYLKAKFSQ